MNNTTELGVAFRAWYREQLKQTIGDNPEKSRYFLFPVKEMMQICIEETDLYLMRINCHAPQKTTAEMLEISRKSVLRATKNISL